jgi:transposase
MQQTAKYVGLDVHQATTVAAVREASGRVIARRIVPTDGPLLLECFRGMRGAIHVTFEAGTQAQWLRDLVAPVVDRVLVGNRRGQTPQGNKGDHADAAQLADLLRRGGLRAVYHDDGHRAALKELARTYQNLVEDGTRVMLRLEALYGELEVLQRLHPQAKAVLLTAAKRDPAWPVLRRIPFLGPVRVALVLATMQTPWRCRTTRHLWAYAGLAVVARTSAEYQRQDRQPIRRKRAPMTRGLNYHAMLARGMREELVRVTLTRKLAALTLRLRKTGERYDPAQLTVQAG